MRESFPRDFSLKRFGPLSWCIPDVWLIPYVNYFFTYALERSIIIKTVCTHSPVFLQPLEGKKEIIIAETKLQ